MAFTNGLHQWPSPMAFTRSQKGKYVNRFSKNKSKSPNREPMNIIPL
jgi:hypothetical protein